MTTFNYYVGDENTLIHRVEESNCEREYYFEYTDFLENWNDGLVSTKSGVGCFGCTLDNKNYFERYSAPTQDLLQKWLRKEYNIHILVYIMQKSGVENNETFFDYSLKINKSGSIVDIIDIAKEFESYEEALEKALQEALTHI